MVELPSYSRCGPLGAPMGLREAPGDTPAEKLAELLRDACRRLSFFHDHGEAAPDEELSYAWKLCAVSRALIDGANRQDVAALTLAQATLLGALAR